MREGYILSGRYQIIKRLGEGGMANVYEARDLILQRDVAVKLLRLDLRDDQAAIRRFQGEAMSLIELDNPHIVSIYDIGEENGLQYLVMEYVKGLNLKQYIEQYSPLDYYRIVEIMEQVLEAVGQAHANGIIHRDLKPQNILLDEQGNVKISDFGIAIAAQSTLTKTNTMLGSVHYISPEQAHGSIITNQSDIYSLGIILFELLTGHVPYEGQTAVSVALKHYQAQMPNVTDLNPTVPQSLENIVLHATAKELTDRYKSVGEMAVDLRTALQPSRLQEPRWQPHGLLDDQTKVLPQITPEMITQVQEQAQAKDFGAPEKAVSNTDKTPQKITKNKKKWSKKKKLAVFGSLGIVLALLLLSSYFIFTTPATIKLPDLSNLSQTQATAKLAENNLAVGEVTYANSDTIAKGQVIKTQPEANTEVKEGAKIDLLISKGPQKETFGDYRGQDYSDVKERLTKQGVTVYKKEVNSSDYAQGEIVSQSVSAKKKVIFSKTSVTFSVSKGPQSYELRDLTNYTLKSVQDYANDMGLTLKVEQEYSDEVTNDAVIKQEPAAGTQIQRGDTLTVTISKGVDPAKESSKPADDESYESFSINVKIPYQQTTATTGNTIQVYLEDQNHSLNDLYQSFDITRDTTLTLPFILENGKTGKYRIYRDGQLIARNDNVTNN